MICYIDKYREQFGVEPICKVLPIAPSTYYNHKHLARNPDQRSDRAKRDEQLEPEIERVWKENFEVYGVKNGYAGLIAGDWQVLSRRDVGGIMQHGGTILGSARCPEFKTEAGREESVRQLRRAKLDALIVIGGNGSQTGSYAISKLGFPVVGVASTIDNDLFGSDLTIGVDTALNVALESIDRLRNTAASHHRAFLVEVMGRNCGYLALMTAIAGGAEAVVLPESEIDPEQLAAELVAAYDRGKSHAIVIVAEGSLNNSAKLMQHFQRHHERIGFQLRATILGHVQRGGNPNAFE